MSEPRPFRLKKLLARKGWERAVRWGVFLAVCGAIAAGAGFAALYIYFAPTLPQFERLEDYQPKVGTRIYSADNQLIAEFAAERRVMVPFERIPPQLFNAFIAAEDKRFRKHRGLDVWGILQAVFDKVRNPKSKLRGASTITQQVAKSLLAIHESYASATERSLVRKIREALLARQLESKLSKDEIIYMYVHEIFLGHKAYGVQAAAEHYYQKNVWELSLAEIATLAGLPQRPSDYSPVSRPEAAFARRRYVVRRMLADGYITQEEADQAINEEITTYPRRELYLQIAPYYSEQIRRILVDRYGERAMLEDGLHVYTSLHADKQAYAQKAIEKHLRALDKRQGYRGALTRLETHDLRQRFIHEYRKDLKLADGQKLDLVRGEIYLALVTAVSSTEARVDVAGQEGVLPLAAMKWARKPNPVLRVDLHYVEDARRVLNVGDVIMVRPTTKDALRKDVHAWNAIDTVPDEGQIFMLEQEPIAQAALLSVDPESGYVVAKVGGYHFEESSFNRAIQACREPGSAFKPIVYSAAIDKLDYTPSTMVDDKPLVFDDPDNEVRWKPSNAGLDFRGSLPLRTCLQDSVNTPAIRLAEAVGITDIIKNARRMGINTPLKRELGTALGSSCTTLHDLTQVYVTLNQLGERRDYVFIRRVVDRFGNILEDHSVSWDPAIDFGSRLDRAYARLMQPKREALDPPTAYMMVSMLKNAVENGTGARARRLGLPTAGKTGTTNDSYDTWFMGFTPDLVTGAWVGHDKKERPLGVNEFGGSTALPIWLDYMESALTDYTGANPKKKDERGFMPPRGVVRVSIDPETGLLARPDSRARVSEYYRAGTEPSNYTPDRSVLNPEEVSIFGAESEL